jgi:hypothetical protein
MAGGYFAPTGLSPLDYTPGGIRTDMSDYLYVALKMETNLLAAVNITAPGGGGTGLGNAVQQPIHAWPEKRLNPRNVTDLTGGGLGAGTDHLVVSLADAGLLYTGYNLRDRAQNILTAEVLRVKSVVPQVGGNAFVYVDRGLYGTTATTHAASAIFDIAGVPVQPGSAMGRDQSRVPGYKQNVFTLRRRDVVITGQVVSLAQHGMIPGTANPVAEQLNDRFQELLQDMNRELIGETGTPGSTQDNYNQQNGILQWLGYAPTPANSSATLLSGGGAPLSDIMFSSVAIQAYLNGGDVPDAACGHPYIMDSVSRFFRDNLRLTQDELIRGVNVDAVRASIGQHPVKLLMDGYLPDPTVNEAILVFLDLDRWGTVPFLDRFCFLIMAESDLDADTVSVLSESTVEGRNTGADFGQTSFVLRNFTLP